MKRYLKYTVLLLMGLNLLGQNKVLLLDGQGDYVALPQPIIDSGTFTIEAWYSIEGDGRITSTGIYFARLVAGEHSHVVKMLYLK